MKDEEALKLVDTTVKLGEVKEKGEQLTTRFTFFSRLRPLSFVLFLRWKLTTSLLLLFQTSMRSSSSEVMVQSSIFLLIRILSDSLRRFVSLGLLLAFLPSPLFFYPN